MIEDSGACVPSRFAEIVAAYGDRPAVIAGEREYNYSELNLEANRLAWALAERTAGQSASPLAGQSASPLAGGWAIGFASGEWLGTGQSETLYSTPPVALMCAHDVGLIIAIMGVLKTGRAYTVLQTDAPPARLLAILDSLQTEAIICDASHLNLAETLARGEAAARPKKVLCLSRDTEGQPGHDLPLAIAADDLAAINFTSGSTGEPKGVMRSHRGLLHRRHLDEQLKGIGCLDRIAFLFAASFGASQADLFGALLSGAALCIYDLRRQGIAPLAGWINAVGLTRLHLPVELFRQWLEILPPDAHFPTLAEVAPAGRLFRRDLEKARPHLPEGCKIITRLSSGETNLISQMAIDVHAPIADDVIPVGRLVPGVEIEFVDETGPSLALPAGPSLALPAGQTVGSGDGDSAATGEIIVSSRFLSPGYWRRPDLTAKVFTESPGRPGWQRFRTGDWGRMRPDGVLEFHGRRDERVKVRGHTVELSGVEAALASLPEVRSAAVIAQEMSDDSKRLVAFFVPANGDAAPPRAEPRDEARNSPTDSDLRQALSRFLPSYMIPAVFVRLDSLPLNANSKVDRRALLGLVPPPATRNSPSDYLAPRNETEEKLAQIWAEVLGLDAVGVHDNFIELGGNSILAARIVARVIRTLPESSISTATLFTAPTVADMAAQLVDGDPATAMYPSPLSAGDRENAAGSGRLGTGQHPHIAALLAELEALSDDEAASLVRA